MKKSVRCFGKQIDHKKFNILLNAVAVMLVYSGHFGMAAIAPIILKSMEGINGINEHLIFTGMAISSFVTVVGCPLISPMIDKLGTKVCLIGGGMLISALHPTLFYPIPIIFLIGQGLNGIGCALLRAASLKFLTDNSSQEDLAKNNGLHWSIFMMCIFVGNLVVLIATGNNSTISENLRMRLCGSLLALSMSGVALYLFTRRTSSHKTLEENTPLLEEETVLYEKGEYGAKIRFEDSNSSSDDDRLSCIKSTKEQSESGFWDSTKHLKKWSTLNLLFIMFNCGTFPTIFATLGPIFIGHLLEKKLYIPLFGMFAGVGEMVGSLLAGTIITKLGIKKSAGFVALCAAGSVVLSGLVFPLHTGAAPVIQPRIAIILLIGFSLGMGDATNGVMLSTLIGRIYKDYSQAGFALYSCIFNLSCITIYFISSYNTFGVMVAVFLVMISMMLIATLFLKKCDIKF